MDSIKTPARVKSGGTQISRRTVTRGVAWSAPIAAVAYAAPAFAASQPVTVQLCGTICKHPGNSGPDDTFKIYHFTFCFTASQAIVGNTVTITSMTINGVTKTAASGAVTPTSVSITPGSTVCYYIDALEFPDSANGSARLDFSYTKLIGGNPDPAGATTGFVQATFNGIDRCGTSDHGVNPKDWPHPSDGTAVPPPANNNCL
jgi:hypothetical protein